MEMHSSAQDRAQIAKRKAILVRQISLKTKALAKAPAGYLRILSGRGKNQYYQVLPGNGKKGNPVYLSKKDMKLAGKLAQKAYDKEVLHAAERELKAWNMLAAFFPEHTVEEVYATLSPARQALVVPVIETDEEFRAKWEAVTYQPGYIRADAPVFMTDRGERVRSKSEQLIAVPLRVPGGTRSRWQKENLASGLHDPGREAAEGVLPGALRDAGRHVGGQLCADRVLENEGV